MSTGVTLSSNKLFLTQTEQNVDQFKCNREVIACGASKGDHLPLLIEVGHEKNKVACRL